MSQSSATNTLNEQASRILEQATQAGATADLIIDQSQSLSLSANKGLLEKHEVSFEHGQLFSQISSSTEF